MARTHSQDNIGAAKENRSFTSHVLVTSHGCDPSANSTV